MDSPCGETGMTTAQQMGYTVKIGASQKIVPKRRFLPNHATSALDAGRLAIHLALEVIVDGHVLVAQEKLDPLTQLRGVKHARGEGRLRLHTFITQTVEESAHCWAAATEVGYLSFTVGCEERHNVEVVAAVRVVWFSVPAHATDTRGFVPASVLLDFRSVRAITDGATFTGTGEEALVVACARSELLEVDRERLAVGRKAPFSASARSAIDAKTIYVSQIPQRTTEEELQQIFSEFGPVSGVWRGKVSIVVFQRATACTKVIAAPPTCNGQRLAVTMKNNSVNALIDGHLTRKYLLRFPRGMKTDRLVEPLDSCTIDECAGPDQCGRVHFAKLNVDNEMVDVRRLEHTPRLKVLLTQFPGNLVSYCKFDCRCEAYGCPDVHRASASAATEPDQCLWIDGHSTPTVLLDFPSHVDTKALSDVVEAPGLMSCTDDECSGPDHCGDVHFAKLKVGDEHIDVRKLHHSRYLLDVSLVEFRTKRNRFCQKEFRYCNDRCRFVHRALPHESQKWSAITHDPNCVSLRRTYPRTAVTLRRPPPNPDSDDSDDDEARPGFQLRSAAGRGDVEGVCRCLSRGDAAASSDDSGWTALHLAVRCGHAAVVDLLLNSTSMKLFDLETQHGLRPLHVAANSGAEGLSRQNVEIGQKLLSAGASVDAASQQGWTALHSAAFCNDGEFVTMLLENGANVNAQHAKGWTALQSACARGLPDVVDRLLSKGDVNVDLPDENGWTPLHSAAREGHTSIIKSLIAFRANVRAKTRSHGLLPLHLCSAIPALKELWKATGINAASDDGSTVLHLLARNGAAAEVRFLLNRGADINIEDTEGWTALHKAAWEGHTTVISALLHSKPSIKRLQACEKHPEQSMCTPLHLAAQRNHVNAVRLLAGPNSVDSEAADGRTPLHHAAMVCSTEVVKLLIRRGARVDAQDHNGQTPLHVAVQARSSSQCLIELLPASPDVGGTTVHGGSAFLQDNDGLSPVHHAARLGNLVALRVFSERGLVPPTSLTPLDEAAGAGQLQAVQLLIHSGAVPNGQSLLAAASSGHPQVVLEIQQKMSNDVTIGSVTDHRGATALHVAAENGKAQALPPLQLNPMAVDDSGATALHYAARNGHASTVQHLVELDSRTIRAENNTGETALESACTAPPSTVGLPATVQFLVECVCAAEELCGNGDLRPVSARALHAAAAAGNAAVVPILLATGNVPVDSPDMDGWTALQKATRDRHSEVVRVLLSHAASPFERNHEGLAAVDLARLSEDVLLNGAFLDSHVQEAPSLVFAAGRASAARMIDLDTVLGRVEQSEKQLEGPWLCTTDDARAQLQAARSQALRHAEAVLEIPEDALPWNDEFDSAVRAANLALTSTSEDDEEEGPTRPPGRLRTTVHSDHEDHAKERAKRIVRAAESLRLEPFAKKLRVARSEKQRFVAAHAPWEGDAGLARAAAIVFASVARDEDLREVERFFPGYAHERHAVPGVEEFCEAVRMGNRAVVEEFLDNNYSIVAACDSHGVPPLHHAVKSGDLDMLDILLEWRADPTQMDRDGNIAQDFVGGPDSDLLLEVFRRHRTRTHADTRPHHPGSQVRSGSCAEGDLFPAAWPTSTMSNAGGTSYAPEGPPPAAWRSPTMTYDGGSSYDRYMDRVNRGVAGSAASATHDPHSSEQCTSEGDPAAWPLRWRNAQ